MTLNLRYLLSNIWGCTTWSPFTNEIPMLGKHLFIMTHGYCCINLAIRKWLYLVVHWKKGFMWLSKPWLSFDYFGFFSIDVHIFWTCDWNPLIYLTKKNVRTHIWSLCTNCNQLWHTNKLWKMHDENKSIELFFQTYCFTTHDKLQCNIMAINYNLHLSHMQWFSLS